MVRSFNLGHHSSSIHSINPTPGNSLDPIHFFNRLYRYSIRILVFKITSTHGKEKNYAQQLHFNRKFRC